MDLLQFIYNGVTSSDKLCLWEFLQIPMIFSFFLPLQFRIELIKTLYFILHFGFWFEKSQQFALEKVIQPCFYVVNNKVNLLDFVFFSFSYFLNRLMDFFQELI